MARIKIKDIPKNRKISTEEMRNVLGGHLIKKPYMLLGQRGGAKSKWRQGSTDGRYSRIQRALAGPGGVHDHGHFLDGLV